MSDTEALSNYQTVCSALIERILDAKDKIHAAKCAKAEAEHDEQLAKAELLQLMQESGVLEEDHPLAKVNIKRGVMSVVVDMPEALPAQFTRTKVEPDKRKIGDALKEGKSVLGCRYERGSDTLTINTKGA